MTTSRPPGEPSLDEDVAATLRTDPVMAGLVDEHGPVTVEPADNEYERLCVSIINQQLSSASADAIRERVFDAVGGELTPEIVLGTDVETLRDAGLSATKVEYMRNAAQAFRERDLTRDGLAAHSDAEVIDELTAITGVGEWTARMYLLFVLGREDVLPLGDLVIRKGIKQVYADGGDLSRAEMRDIAEQWRPYRSYGSRYIWKAYESP